ncbi:hypothetical protein D5S17_07420 [Pseudonocardiaceae bacterium YIM PH 21723]|nr:hypothetical protein D5S17_07420 [Pseudonocardiaceae bacterium YIM PH 21723]
MSRRIATTLAAALLFTALGATAASADPGPPGVPPGVNDFLNHIGGQFSPFKPGGGGFIPGMPSGQH